MARKGLGKGLDSLIPNFYNDEFDSNSTESLEDILNNQSEEEKIVDEVINHEEEDTSIDKVEDSQESEKDVAEVESIEEVEERKETSAEESVQEKIQDPHIRENVEEVKEIVEKNPRITLWSSRSSAVFRYLRKTEPEFSISKEAASLIDDAVSKKYPDIWKLFE